MLREEIVRMVNYKNQLTMLHDITKKIVVELIDGCFIAPLSLNND